MFWKTTMFDKQCKSYFIKLLLKYSFDFNIFFCLCFKLRLKLVGTLSKRGLSYSQVNHLFLVHLNAVLLGCSTSVTVFLCSCFRKALRKSIKHSGNRLKTQTRRTEVEENEMEVETQKHNGSVLGGDMSDGTAAESKNVWRIVLRYILRMWRIRWCCERGKNSR